MAVIAVTKDTPTTVVTANRSLMVTVDVTGVGFHVYLRVGTLYWKAQAGNSISFPVVNGDVVEAKPVGTGNVTVTTVNN